jgi:hypothetical protein
MGNLNLSALGDSAGLALGDTLNRGGYLPYLADQMNEISTIPGGLPFEYLPRLNGGSLEEVVTVSGGTILWILGQLLIARLIDGLVNRENTPQEPSVRLLSAPGKGLIGFAEFFFSRKDREHLAQPILDMRLEYYEALAEKRTWKARVVLVRGYFSFFSAVGMHLSLQFGKSAVRMWKLLP